MMRLSMSVAQSVADRLNYRHNGLVIAVAQDVSTKEVLMVAFMNREAVLKTLTTGYAHYWSTSRRKLWMKGEESGNVQEVEEFLIDCDADAVLIKVRQRGVACHEGYYTCFHNRATEGGLKPEGPRSPRPRSRNPPGRR